MNTKGMKFLAVLAVLAMAFAAFAVVAPAETEGTATTTWSADKKVLTDGANIVTPWTGTDAPTAGHAYYFAENATVNMTAISQDGAAVLFLIEEGKNVTVNMANNNSGTMYIGAMSVKKTTVETVNVYTSPVAAGTGFYTGSALSFKSPPVADPEQVATFGTSVSVWSGNDTNDRVKFTATATGAVLTNAGQINQVSEKGSFTGANGTIVNYYDATKTATWTFDDATVTSVKSNAAGTNVLAFTGFTGEITMKSGVVTITKWTAGSVEVKSAAAANPVIISGGIVVPTNKTLTIDASTAVKIDGKLTNNGTITSSGVISGSGTIDNYGSLTAPVYNSATAYTSVLVNVYNGGTWGGYIDTTTSGDLALLYTAIPGSTAKILSSKTTESGGNITSVVELYTSAELKKASWMTDGTDAATENLTVKAGTLTVPASTGVGAKDTVIFEANAALAPVSGSSEITNAGKIYFAFVDQFDVKITNSENGKVYIDGTTEMKTTTETTINASTVTGEYVIATGAVQTVTPAANQEIVLENVSALTSVTLSNAGSAVSTMAGIALPGAGVSLSDGTNTMKLAGSGKFVFAKGSLVIGAEITAGTTYTIDDGKTIKVYGVSDSGDFVFALADGATSAKIVIDAGTALNAGTNKIIIPAGITLVVYGEVIGNLQNNGTINLMTGGDISNATITGTGSIVDKTNESEMSDLYVNGDSDSGDIVYPATQNVIVDKVWNLINGAKVTINGQLVIPEGTKMTIEAGAELVLANDAKILVEGTLIVEEREGLSVGQFTINAGTVEVTGTFNMNGVLDVNASTQQKGVVNIKSGTTVFGKASVVSVDAAAELNVVSGASLTIKGALDAKTINNQGSVIIATEIPAAGDSTIYMKSNGASVEIQRYTIAKDGYKLTITDEGLVYYFDKATKLAYAVGHTSADTGYGDLYYNKTSGLAIAPPVNKIEITGYVERADYVAIITGLTITENVKSSSSYKSSYYVPVAETGYTSKFAVAGNTITGLTYVGTGIAEACGYEATVTMTGGQGINVLKDTELVVGLETTFVNAGKFTVNGLADFDLKVTSPAAQATFTNNGTVTVDGNGLLTYHTQVAVTINACKIERIIEAVTYYHYYGIDAVLALASEDSSVTDIVALGDNTVNKSATVPANVTLTISGGKVTIGSSTNTGITLAVDDEATVRGSGTIDVKASLYAEDKSALKGNTIKSDVYSCQVDEKGKAVKNGWALWTNMVSALNSASAGDVVTVGRDAPEKVEISGNVEIKEGVTVIVPEGKAPLLLKDGVTLTVSGVLQTAEDIYAYSMFDVTAVNNAGTNDGDKTSAVVVNGAILTLKTTSYNYNPVAPNANGSSKDTAMTAGAPIAGAYYQTDDYNVISSLDFAMSNLEEIISKITVNGTVKALIVDFTATDSCTTLEIGTSLEVGTKKIPTALTVGTLKLDGSKITTSATAADADSYSLFSGIIFNENGSVELNHVKQQKSTAAASLVFTIEDKNGKLVMSGSYAITDKDDVLEIASGTVYSDGITVDTIVSADDKYRTRMAVADGATLESYSNTAGNIEEIIVNGALVVPNEMNMTVGKIVVMGDLTISAATSSKTAGTMTISKLFVGIDEPSFNYNAVADAATVSGKFTLNGIDGTAIILAGATLDDAAAAVLTNLDNSTGIYVENALWFTAYAVNDDTDLTVNMVPVSDAFLNGWASYNGGTRIDFDAGAATEYYKFKIGAHDNLYAVIDYTIYSITVYTDAGIKAVSIDGIEMKNELNNQFVTISGIKAGTHKVTYTLKNGYEETVNGVNLYTADGTILVNHGFTTSGTTNTAITLLLNGTEQIVAPEPSPVEQNEWTITTILLVILVILIAIMAVIVALRLNRS